MRACGNVVVYKSNAAEYSANGDGTGGSRLNGFTEESNTPPLRPVTRHEEQESRVEANTAYLELEQLSRVRQGLRDWYHTQGTAQHPVVAGDGEGVGWRVGGGENTRVRRH